MTGGSGPHNQRQAFWTQMSVGETGVPETTTKGNLSSGGVNGKCTFVGLEINPVTRQPWTFVGPALSKRPAWRQPPAGIVVLDA